MQISVEDSQLSNIPKEDSEDMNFARMFIQIKKDMMPLLDELSKISYDFENIFKKISSFWKQADAEWYEKVVESHSYRGVSDG